jgi:hypothetical protein
LIKKLAELSYRTISGESKSVIEEEAANTASIVQ